MKVAVSAFILIAALSLLVAFYWNWVNRVTSPQPTPEAPMSSVTPSPSAVSIFLTSPLNGETISSPLRITGQARGNWFFEATFPVVLTNWNGLIIAEGYAEAQGEWMTEELVPFVATLEFVTPDYGERGSLILQKANPSGLPENDDALEITIEFL
ncbi:MAG: Gmad2 immunoglobulin-like domain-containing protein [bacterium]|nr:Gmad2 immunoglobulin-like domain-containing protein [bacterium]